MVCKVQAALSSDCRAWLAVNGTTATRAARVRASRASRGRCSPARIFHMVDSTFQLTTLASAAASELDSQFDRLMLSYPKRQRVWSPASGFVLHVPDPLLRSEHVARVASSAWLSKSKFSGLPLQQHHRTRPVP